MNFRELKQNSSSHFYGLSLDRHFPKTWRHVLRKLAAFLGFAAFILSFDILPLFFGWSDAAFFLCLFVYLSLSFLELFYRSVINQGLSSRLSDPLLVGQNRADFALSQVLFVSSEIDLSRSLFESKIGQEIFARCGIILPELKKFIYSERAFVVASALDFGGDFVDLAQYVSVIYDADKPLQNFLAGHSVNREEFIGAARWVLDRTNQKQRKDRFWGRENLGAIPSIGTSWSFGVAADLGRFGLHFESETNLANLDLENNYRQREVLALEGILERKSEANAVIIDDDEKVVRDIVARFVKRIKLGICPPSLEYKEVIELDWPALVASFKERSELEKEILKIFNESIAAGNIIIYIRDLSGFVANLKAMGINLPSLVAPHLSHHNLPIIASATNADFHFFIETTPTLLEKFERIIPDMAGLEASVAATLEQVPAVESQYEVVFSYPAILTLVKSAERFVSLGEMPGKALDLLLEIAPWAVRRKIVLIKENDIALFTSEKTGIATGAIKEKESAKIEHLEELLHKRVVGQDEAVKSVAAAVRRARSGVSSPNRPLASFLFIGPTGVGKTEISKALAESFFGDEKKMIRFDMSEYSGPEATSELLGDFTTGKSGLLSSRVRDYPYSVLLLDEFEKAARDVLDLFLQILDEGIFTDALGHQVNCRNLIIIATSNAGSDLIWDIMKTGKNLNESKDLVVDAIIKNKTFRPELLNRFDGVILFHPLQNNELRNVAKIGLQKLGQRLKEQDIELMVNDDILDFLVKAGADPQFGGRAINRAIADKVENLIAQKIVSGQAGPGSKIELKKEELI